MLQVQFSSPTVLPSGTSYASCQPTVDANGVVTDCTIISGGNGYGIGNSYTVVFGARVISLSLQVGTGAGWTDTTFTSITWTGVPVSGSTAVPAIGITLALNGGVLSATIDNAATTGGGVWSSVSQVTITTSNGGTTAVFTATATTGTGALGRALVVPKETSRAILFPEFTPPLPYFQSTWSNYWQTAQGHAVMVAESCQGTALGTTGVASVILTNGGGGYVSSTSTIFFSGGGGAIAAAPTPATGTDASISGVTLDTTNGLITGLSVAAGSTGYDCAPDVKLFYRGRVNSVRVTNIGNIKFTQAPFVVIGSTFGTIYTGQAGKQAYATATITAAGYLDTVTVTDGGQGYTSTPTVNFYAKCEILSIRLCDRGAGYTTPPSVVISAPLVSTGVPNGMPGGAKATATIQGGEVTGITITNGGIGYCDVNAISVSLVGGTGVTRAATVPGGAYYITVGTVSVGSAAAVAVIEHGSGAVAKATVSGGSVTGITMVSPGPVATNFRDTPTVLGGALSLSNDAGIFTRYELNSAGLPTGIVYRGASTAIQGTPTVTANPVGSFSGITVTPIMGINTAGSSNLIYGLTGPSFSTVAMPSAIMTTISGASRVFNYQDLCPMTASTSPVSPPFYLLNPTMPATGSYQYFPGADWFTNTLNGNGEIGAYFLSVNVKVEIVEYPNINGIVQTATLPYGAFARYRIELPRYWSKINFTTVITSGGDSATVLSIRRLTDQTAACNQYAQAWSAVDTILGIRASSFGASLVPSNPQLKIGSVTWIEVGPTTCVNTVATFPTTPSVTFTIKANVYDFKIDNGECNHYSDCRKESFSHPSGARLGLSANQANGRFRYCQVDYTGYRGICTECVNECDCNPGQYCHTDTGLGSSTNGLTFTVDADSRSRYGLCQTKDPDGSIFGQPCISTGAAPDTTYFRSDTDSNFAKGYCGKMLFYNNSWVDPYKPQDTNTRRSVLWT